MKNHIGDQKEDFKKFRNLESNAIGFETHLTQFMWFLKCSICPIALPKQYLK
jgi:hypothetical protein